MSLQLKNILGIFSHDFLKYNQIVSQKLNQCHKAFINKCWKITYFIFKPSSLIIFSHCTHLNYVCIFLYEPSFAVNNPAL